MPTCASHGYLNCRECFPRPSISLSRRCTAKNPVSGLQCQVQCKDGVNHEGPHSRVDYRGAEAWTNLSWLALGNLEIDSTANPPELLDDDIPF